MANAEKVTVDRGYFDALLRRAKFHTSEQLSGRPDPANITVSRVEYDGLLRLSREYELLKNALFQGGITGETLELLIAGANSSEQRKDSGISVNPCTEDFNDVVPSDSQHFAHANVSAPYREMPWRTGAPAFNFTPGTLAFQNATLQTPQTRLRAPAFQRQASYGMSSVTDDAGLYDDNEFADDETHGNTTFMGAPSGTERRTLYLSGFSERTTYHDLLSVIKGGKLLSVNIRPERSASVTFLQGAAEFLTWTKRNDIYLHTKRIEVKWADRQYHLNAHIRNKIANGATRNIVVHGALEKGLTEAQIRVDMDHIHNLVVIDVNFWGGDAYISMNSIHNALFARTCMISRSTYKGCKIGFYRDECDVPLPARTYTSKAAAPAPVKKKALLTNRFDMLNMDGTEASSDGENRAPSESGSDDQIVDMTSNVGVSLNFQDLDSV